MYDDFTDDYVIDPAQELGLYLDWCRTCFSWEKYEPTEEDWIVIRQIWYPGKAPADAVAEVIKGKGN